MLCYRAEQPTGRARQGTAVHLIASAPAHNCGPKAFVLIAKLRAAAVGPRSDCAAVLVTTAAARPADAPAALALALAGRRSGRRDGLYSAHLGDGDFNARQPCRQRRRELLRLGLRRPHAVRVL